MYRYSSVIYTVCVQNRKIRKYMKNNKSLNKMENIYMFDI